MVPSPAGPQKMLALEIQEFTGLSAIRMGERAIPEVGPNEVLISHSVFRSFLLGPSVGVRSISKEPVTAVSAWQ
jgi:hypothetical protein